jgi:hypothetical protein
MFQAGARWMLVSVMITNLGSGVFTPVVRCAESEVRGLHLFLNGRARMTVKDSIDGAIRRLDQPSCLRLFTEFKDSNGHPLTETLEAWGKNPSDALAGLYFVEGDGSPQCRDETTAAFTVTRSRVIYVCGTRFAERFARETKGGEILLIHELLHALGLGENPPTSAQITNTVMARCGH